MLLHGQQTRNPYNPAPTRTVGHARATVTTFNPNFLEGRELFAPQAIAADTSVNPPILYVADTGNNRVLAWRNPSAAAKGAPADLVIGQRDMITTLAQGPEQNTVELRITGGFSSPTGMAVDRQGNLYVADAGNNRVVRYPRPFDQRNDIVQADLVIGQRAINSGRIANQGVAASNKTLAFSNSAGAFRVGVAVDASNNLWVSDPINNRVLRFPAGQLSANTAEPEADIVIGQPDFTSTRVVDAPSTDFQLNKNNLVNPSGLGFDASGRLFVCDARQRVMVYNPPLQTNTLASRILGTSTRPGLTAERLGSLAGPPEGLFSIGNETYVIDTGNNRIMRYANPDTWAPEAQNEISPQAAGVIGQPDFTQNQPNRNIRGEARSDAFFGPTAGAVAGGYIWIADSNNNRILGFPRAPSASPTACWGSLISSIAVQTSPSREASTSPLQLVAWQASRSIIRPIRPVCTLPIRATIECWDSAMPATCASVIFRTS
jgi:sugar lactone lactonase YvrE